MKLQIVEYRVLNMLNGNRDHRYMLELDGRVIKWTLPTLSEKEFKQVYNELMENLLSDGIKDFNLEHYMKFNDKSIPGIEREVLFEIEVSDTYLKELYSERRIRAIEDDFK